MSLKNIIKKTIASFGAISLIFGNCSMCGMGLIKVIAEDLNAPQIGVEIVNSKYVQYQYTKTIQEVEQVIQEGENTKQEDIKGIAVQSKLSVYPIYSQDTYLPTENVEISLNMPRINEYLPEKAAVIEALTKSTTGEELNTKINQNYDSNSGLLTVSYENTPDENENIYSSYNENAKDEFEIIYIYPAEAYTGNENEIKLDYSVIAKMTFKTENGSITSESIENLELLEKENKGYITTFGVTNLKNKIYKGFMYSNLQNKTSYDTEYTSVSTFAVLNSQVIEEVTMKLEESKFVLNDEEKTEISANGNILYKATKINKNEFDKILGQLGRIEIYQEETHLATVKYLDEDTKKLAIFYSEEDVRVLDDSTEIIEIEYPENITSLNIKTSKPVKEGFIHFENLNIIKATEDYGASLENIEKIKINSLANEFKSAINLLLSEPETKITVESSNTNFSTLQENKATITIKLDNTNISTKLFNNPTLTLKLPEGIVGGNISSPSIINGNGLEIDGDIQLGENENTVIIKLKGEQISYDLNNVSGGTTIVMDIESLDYKDTIPSHSDKIEVECTQGEETVKASQDVNIVSKAGLLMYSQIKGYDAQNNVTTNIDSNIKEITIVKNEDKKQIEQTLTLVNNYDGDLNNVQVIGKIGYTNSEITSTFDTNLTKEITVDKEGIKIYYSENKEAKIDDESWTEEFTNKAKLYKIVLQENKLEKQGTVTIKANIEIPANLGYNQVTFIRTEVNYLYQDNYMEDSSNFVIVTEENELYNNTNVVTMQLTNQNNEEIPVKLTVTPVITQNYVHSGQVVTYKIAVQNESDKDLNNIIVQDIIPENAIYTYRKIVEGNVADYYETVEEPETKLKEWNIETLKAKEVKEYEIILTMNSVQSIEEILNTIRVIYGNQTKEIQNKLTLKPAIIHTELDFNGSQMINLEFSENSTVEYYVKVKNITGNKINGINVEYPIPQYLEYISGGLGNKDEFKGYSIEQEGILNENIFKYNISSLKPQEERVIVIRCRVQNLDQTYEAAINGIANVYVGEEVYETNIKQIKTVQAGFNISLESNIAEGTILKKDDIVVYTIKVENIGKRTSVVTLKDNIPNQILIDNIEYSTNGENIKTMNSSTGEIDLNYTLSAGEILIVNITGRVKEISTKNEELIQINNSAKLISNEKEIESNKITLSIQTEWYFDYNDIIKDDEGLDIDWGNDNKEDEEEDIKNIIDLEDMPTLPEQPTEPEIPEDPEEPTDPEIPSDPEQPDEPTDPETPEEPEVPEEPTQPEIKTYIISGVAWLDFNKNGQKDQEEQLMNNITVTLVNKQTGNYALDAAGNKITAITNLNGEYKFENLQEGEYIVLFEFDTSLYTVTTYQKTDVEQTVNSDAIITKVTINGQEKLAAITDNIVLNSSKENIGIGLVENAVFDLSLDKKITKITVINKQGTQTIEYEDGQTAKVDLVAKYMAGSEVIVTYKFIIKNEGDVTGYVDSLVDDIPSGLAFNSEMNKDWYKGSDGSIYTTSLSGKAIKPGETSEIELVLTKTMTEENAGTFPNSAKLEKISNLENIAEKEDAKENNESSAILFISIKTGSVILYISITTICIAIIAIGAYIIKKKILDRGI